MRTLRLGSRALILAIALAAAGLCVLDAIQPQQALSAQVADNQGLVALVPSAESAGEALAGQGASGTPASHQDALDHSAHGEGGSGHASPVVPVLTVLLLVIVAARLGGALMERLGQPGVLGELLAGVLLGNLTLVGFKGVESLFAAPLFGGLPVERVIEILGEIGVILLLFEVGLESNVRQMLSVGTSSLLVALLGVAAPFLLGWGVGKWLLPDQSYLVHLFLGAILTATSVGITARVLKDLGKTGLRESRIILGAAVIDDIVGLVILAVVSGIIVAAESGGPGIGAAAISLIVGKALLFLVVALVAGQWLSPRLFWLAARLRGGNLLLPTSLLFLFALSIVAGKIGLATIVGAFAAGLVLDELHYSELKQREQRGLEELLQPLLGFFVPIFFVYMGYRVDLSFFARPELLGLAGALTLAAVIGKQICGLGVAERGLDRLSIGLGMIPRGEVGLIFASIGLGLTAGGEPIVSEATYGAVVIMVILTTLLTPPLLKWSLGRSHGYEGASEEEMRRIANERRERRKEYYRQKAREDGREEGRREGERERGRRGGRSGRGGRNRDGEERGGDARRGEGRAEGRGEGRGTGRGAGRGEARAEGRRSEGRGGRGRGGESPTDSTGAAPGAAAGREAGERRHRPRRRRRRGGGGESEAGGGGADGSAPRQTQESAESSAPRGEPRSLKYADSI